MWRSLFNAEAAALWTVYYGGGVILEAYGARREEQLIRGQKLWAEKMLASCGVSVAAAGMPENGGPYVIVSNHASHFDTPALVVGFKIPLYFVAKRELLKVPVLGRAIEAYGHIVIDRGDSEQSRQRLAEALEQARGGRSVLFFAEGTRGDGESLRPFKKGAFVFAIQAGLPILPVALAGSARVLAKDSWQIRPGRIAVHAGKPIPTAGLALGDRDRLLEKTRRAVARELAAAKKLLALGAKE